MDKQFRTQRPPKPKRDTFMRDLKRFKLYNPLLFSQKAFGVRKIGYSFSVDKIGDLKRDE